MFQSRPNDSNKEDSGMAELKKQVEARFARFKKAFAGPLTEAYIEFFISVILLFTSYKLFFQRSDPLAHLLYQGFNPQKQPSIGVFIKRCSENIPQIYRRTTMSKCDFNKVEENEENNLCRKSTLG